MKGHPTDKDVMARALVDSTLVGDEAAAKKHGLSVRTLQRARARLDSDNRNDNVPTKTLAEVVAEKKALIDGDWAEELPEAIRGAIGFLKRASDEATASDPDAIHAVAGALKILTSVTMARRVLDRKLGEAARHVGDSGRIGSTGEAARQSASGRADESGAGTVAH